MSLHHMNYMEIVFLHPCKMLCEIYMLYLLGFIAHIVCVVDLAGKKTLQR